MRRFILAPPLLALLAACEVPATPPPGGDLCGAAGAQAFVGGPAAALFATTFAQPVRFIRPGDVVTMDFREDRLNFDIDANEVVTAARCG